MLEFPVVVTRLDVVMVAIDPESSLEDGMETISVDHDSRPAGICPFTVVWTSHVSVSLEYLVLGAIDRLDGLDAAVGVEDDDLGIVVYDIVIRF